MSILTRRSRLAYPVTIAESTLVLRETTSTFTLTIPAGEYWNYLGTEYGTRDSLLEEIRTQIAASAAAGSYTFEASVPSESVGEGGTRRGLAFQRTAGSGSWGIDWSSSTLDPTLLGYPSGYSTDVATTLDHLSSPREVRGVWIPVRYRREASRDPVRDIKPSSDDVASANYHQSDYGDRTNRRLVYSYLPAATVIKGKDSTYRNIVNVSDDNGCFERLWDSMKLRDDIIIFYEMDPVTIDADAAGLTYEIVRLREGATRLRDNLRMMNMGGEFYEVTLELAVVEGNRSD